MPIVHTSRTGKQYYLHTGPKRGGGVQHFFSTDPAGSLAERVPEGFEIYESINGQVLLRRQKPQLIRADEMACIEQRLSKLRTINLYKVEARGNTLTIFESAGRIGDLRAVLGRI